MAISRRKLLKSAAAGSALFAPQVAPAQITNTQVIATGDGSRAEAWYCARNARVTASPPWPWRHSAVTSWGTEHLPRR